MWKFKYTPVFCNSQALHIVKIVSKTWNLYERLLGFGVVFIINATKNPRIFNTKITDWLSDCCTHIFYFYFILEYNLVYTAKNLIYHY
jgi:hypothetical protein